jgi:hypothetical protein
VFLIIGGQYYSRSDSVKKLFDIVFKKSLGVIGTETFLFDSNGEKLYVGDIVKVHSEDYDNFCLVVDDGKFKYVNGIRNHWYQNSDGVVTMYNGKWAVSKVVSYEKLTENAFVLMNSKVSIVDGEPEATRTIDKVGVRERLLQVIKATRCCISCDPNCSCCPFGGEDDMCDYIMTYKGDFHFEEDRCLDATIDYLVYGKVDEQEE